MTSPLEPSESPAPHPDRVPRIGLAGYPVAKGALPTTESRRGDYVLRFAQTPDELDAILELRFEVFNLELNEGLQESFQTGKDEDELDARFHHLAISLESTGDIVGTYRMQTAQMAEALGGFYSEGEFDLSGVPPDILRDSAEIGRACVAKEHRNGRVLQLLWRGLAQYLMWNDKRYLFGCCSLTSQDRDLGFRVHQYLIEEGHAHPACRVLPRDGLECPTDPVREGPRPDVHIPALFQSYLNLGARVCGPPAIDRQFQTIDYLVLLDTHALDERIFRVFFR
jgi:putative hemolysin